MPLFTVGLDDNTRQSNKGTIKEECPFKIRCKYNDNLWSFLIIVHDHNHELLENITADSRENPVVSLVTAADAELTLYKQAPPIKLKKDDGTFNCPLLWWKYNERKYKLLSILASQLLSIPATSAPSEHVFSVAGLTISKDRARLASDVANELVFLNDALPGVQKYYEAQNAQNALY